MISLSRYKSRDTDGYLLRYADGVLTDKASFAYGTVITFDFYIKSDYNPHKVYFYLGNDDRVILSIPLDLKHSHNGYNCYGTDIDTKDITGDKSRGLFFYHFEFINDSGRFYTKTDGINCELSLQYENEWQLSVFDEEYASPEWLDRGVIYHIFVDRFAKSGDEYRREDAIYLQGWDNTIPEFPKRVGDSYPNNSFFGGNFTGIIKKLDYLKDLGVSCIYLSPISKAFSNHKYDVGDYLQTDPSFGGDEGLAELITKAGAKGIKIILDGVFNHVGDDSRYFNKYGKYPNKGAFQSKDSSYYPWFHFSNFPHKYDSWWGITNLPKIKSDCLEYQDFICDKVIPKYMKMGVAGWRLDVVDELRGSFTKKIAKAIKDYKSDALLVGEVWDNASNKIAYDERKEYLLGQQLDSVTNYPIKDGIIRYLLSKDARELKLTVQTLYEHYPDHKLQYLMNIIGTHDTERILTVLSGRDKKGKSNTELAYDKLSTEERERAGKLLKLAYMILAFLPGVPCIYYGDEAGMEGWHDPFNRRPFPWNNIDMSLLDWFKTVNRIRLAEKFSCYTDFIIYNTEDSVFVAEKKINSNKLFVCINMSDKTLMLEDILTPIDKCCEIVYNNLEIPPESGGLFKKTENIWHRLLTS